MPKLLQSFWQEQNSRTSHKHWNVIQNTSSLGIGCAKEGRPAKQRCNLMRVSHKILHTFECIPPPRIDYSECPEALNKVSQQLLLNDYFLCMVH